MDPWVLLFHIFAHCFSHGPHNRAIHFFTVHKEQNRTTRHGNPQKRFGLHLFFAGEYVARFFPVPPLTAFVANTRIHKRHCRDHQSSDNFSVPLHFVFLY